MKNKDSLETGFVAWALTGDALALFGAFMLAVWLRFDSNLFAVRFGRIPDLYEAYARGGLVFALIGLWICARLGLYRRPQRGRFESKIPRLARACGLTTLASAVLAFAVRNYVMEFSTGVLALSLPTGVFCLLAQRYVLFRIELHCARHSRAINRVLILGTGEVAARLRRGLRSVFCAASATSPAMNRSTRNGCWVRWTIWKRSSPTRPKSTRSSSPAHPWVTPASSRSFCCANATWCSSTWCPISFKC